MSAPPLLVPALERLRAGDLAGARREIDRALNADPSGVELLHLGSLVAARLGDPGSAASYLERLLVLRPHDTDARIRAASALVAAGEPDRAEVICGDGSEHPQLGRLAAYLHQQRGRPELAVPIYDRIVEADPDDWESWNNLGSARIAIRDFGAAAVALDRAVQLRPDQIAIYLNLSEALAKSERFDARAAVMRTAARRAPRDTRVQMELGLAEAGARDPEAAERAFREAIRLDEGFSPAILELGLLLENLNRIEALAELIAEIERRQLDAPELVFLRAWLLRRQGRLEDALGLAEATPETINPVRRAQLLADLYDRSGDSERAFASFVEMNEASLAARVDPSGPSYRETVEQASALLVPERVAAWSRLAAPSEPAPVFVVGFPRSGTTLLDTLLMNVPGLHVLEEQPMLREVGARLGDPSRLETLSEQDADDLRALYFEVLDRVSPAPPGSTIVDKFPLHMAEMPLIHRLFPDARVILVERHPLDAVLSCFMANFQLNRAMRSFTNIAEAARTYHAVFEHWSRATRLLPIRTHRVRYENMVEDLEAEMRPLLGFLGIAWTDRVLDNRGSAARRDHIRTASYSQVGEPIYRRAAGRWKRYRPQLEPVLPILRPWIDRLGYALED